MLVCGFVPVRDKESTLMTIQPSNFDKPPRKRSSKTAPPQPEAAPTTAGNSKGKRGKKKGDEGGASSPAEPAEFQTKSHGAPKCGAVRRGKACGQAAGWGTDHPGSGKCKLHGGKTTGPKTAEGKARSRENGLKHGLFSKSLGPLGLDVYKGAKRYRPEDLGRHAAEFVLAQVAQAFEESDDLEHARNEFEEWIWAKVAAEEMSSETAAMMVRKLRQPAIDQLGKALSPLKGLLEVKKAEEAAKNDPIAALSAIIEQSRKLRDEQEED